MKLSKHLVIFSLHFVIFLSVLIFVCFNFYRNKVNEVYDHLFEKGYNVDFYHSILATNEKTRALNEWQSGIKLIMVATNAFGMGIDKKDCRYVIHFTLPDSMTKYAQESMYINRILFTFY